MRRYATALAMLCICAAPARAQDELLETCASATSQVDPGVPTAVLAEFQFMCAQVVNALANVQPSVGIAFSGGNPVLGTGTTLGKRLGFLPKISATARANVAFADVPDLFDAYSSQFDDSTPLGAAATLGVPIAALQGDVALGVFSGVSAGPMVGGVGAIDLLGSVAFLPKIDQVGLTEAIMNIGVGARVGILRQGLLVPGVSVSGMYRIMDEIAFGDVAAGDPGEFTTDLHTLSVRGVVSKGVLAFDFAVGAGYDRYTSDLSLDWNVTCTTAECLATDPGGLDVSGQIEGELSTATWNVFGDVALNLLMLNLVAEVGYQKAIDPITPSDLTDAGLPSRPLTTAELGGGRVFGSVGLRLSL